MSYTAVLYMSRKQVREAVKAKFLENNDSFTRLVYLSDDAYVNVILRDVGADFKTSPFVRTFLENKWLDRVTNISMVLSRHCRSPGSFRLPYYIDLSMFLGKKPDLWMVGDGSIS